VELELRQKFIVGMFEQALCEPVTSICLIIDDEDVLEQAARQALTGCLEASNWEITVSDGESQRPVLTALQNKDTRSQIKPAR